MKIIMETAFEKKEAIKLYNIAYKNTQVLNECTYNGMLPYLNCNWYSGKYILTVVLHVSKDFRIPLVKLIISDYNEECRLCELLPNVDRILNMNSLSDCGCNEVITPDY